MKKNIQSKTIAIVIMAILSTAAFSDLVILDDTGLARISGQLLVDPLVDLEDLMVKEDRASQLSHTTAAPFDNSYMYNPLSSIDLAEQRGQGIRFVHTQFPTGGRSPDTRVGNNGNINFYGRDYRTGDNFDRASDCFQNACGTGTGWDADGDGIPGNGGSADFVPNGNGDAWESGADGHVDDLYYEYDWYGEYGANGGVPDSTANWHFYRMETDALIKVIATINRMSMGGYTANTGSCASAFESVESPPFGGDTNFIGLNNGGCNGGWSNYSDPVAGTEYQDTEAAYKTNYENSVARKLGKDDITNYFNYDSEIRNIQAGAVSCGSVTDARAEFLEGNAAYFGNCEADERVYDPLTLKNPFTEIALAPECELFADPDCDAGGSTDLVFAGYRSGFESVSGNLRMTQYSSTGSTNAALPGQFDIQCNGTGVTFGGDLGTSDDVCNGYRKLLSTFATDGVLLFGHRSRGMGALPGALCVSGSQTVLFVTVGSTVCPELGTGGEGLQSNVAMQDVQGLWSSTVRNDFQWPGQGWAADDGNTTSASNFRTTLADRDYGGVNTHISTGATGHGGTVINNYSPAIGGGILGTLGEAITHTEIAL